MKAKEQLQAEIIEKQKEIDKAKDVVIEHYKNCLHKLTLYSPETIGYQEGVIKNIKSELSALESEGEEETCWNCKQREGEECGITGKEVYEDTPKCSQYSQK